MNAFDLTEDQQDCLQELINVAMGQASDQLARYLDTFVYLKVPSIEQVKSEHLCRYSESRLKAKPPLLAKVFLVMKVSVVKHY